MTRFMLRWPWLTLAFFLAGVISLGPAGGAPLRSQLSAPGRGSLSPLDFEKELIASHLAGMGLDRGRIDSRLAGLSVGEIHRLALSLDAILSGGAEQEKKAAGVAIAIIIALGVIVGIYLFYNANN